jgi:hypothetical protein
VASPAWQALPNLNVPRDKVTSVLLPDGRVFVAGGIETMPDGGPVEIFDPTPGFLLGPNMKHIRGYHSAAILLPDGSIVKGGDPNGGTTPIELSSSARTSWSVENIIRSSWKPVS